MIALRSRWGPAIGMTGKILILDSTTSGDGPGKSESQCSIDEFLIKPRLEEKWSEMYSKGLLLGKESTLLVSNCTSHAQLQRLRILQGQS